MNFKQINFKSVIEKYGPTAIATSVYYLTLFLFFSLSKEAVVPYQITYGIMALGTASSISFMYFFSRYKCFFNENILIGTVASFIYGASAYILISSLNIAALIVHVIFPIVVSSVIGLLEASNPLPVIIQIALLTIISPRDIVPLIFVSLIVVFVICRYKKNNGVFLFVKYLCSVLLGLLIGSFRLFSKFVDYRIQNEGYSGFFLSYYPVILSFLVFVGIVLFFINKQNNNRVICCILFVFLLLCRAISPLAYLFSAGVYEYNNWEAYDILIVFAAICFAFRGIAYYEKGKKNISIICVIGVLFSLFTFIMQRVLESGFQNYILVLVSIIIGFLCVVLLCFSNWKSRFILSSIIMLLVFLEVTVNSMILSGQQYLCDGPSLVDETEEAFDSFYDTLLSFVRIDSEKEEPEEIFENKKKSGIVEEYREFYKDHYDSDIAYLVAMVDKYIDISEEEKKQYGAGNGDRFEIINAKCRKAGIKEDLFTPVEGYKLIFDNSNSCRVNNIASGLYNFEFKKIENGDIEISEDGFCYASFKIELNTNDLSNVYLFVENSDLFLKLKENDLNGTDRLYIRFQPQEYVDINLRFPMYRIANNTQVEIATNTVVNYINETRNNYIHGTDIIGLVFSFIGLTITILCFLNVKGKCYVDVVDEKIKSFVESKSIQEVKTALIDNRIYILSFLIPFIVIVSNLAIFNCIPFGNNFIFDSDGVQITLPSYLELGNVMRNDSLFFSIDAGYGFGFFAPNLLSFAFMPLKNMSARWGMTFLSIGEAALIGLAGFTMAVFLVNRKYGVKAKKNNVGILFAAVVYSCNYFFLSMHSYNEWYINYALLPLVILGLEKLIYEKKPLLYWITLMLSTVNSIQPAMYMCIFVFIWFMFIEHKGIIDFIKNTVCVAVVSILGILPGGGLMYTAIWGTNDSHYREEDSLFPQLGFHKNFFDQWKSFLIFSPTEAVNTDDGGLSAYVGILILVVIVVFVVYNRNSIRQKIRLIGPAVLILVSINGKVLSFIWDGFHYQSNVPNRYAFLLMFLLAIMAYEGINMLKNIELKQILISFATVFSFILLCYFFGEESSDLQVIASLIILFLWLVIFVIINKRWVFSSDANKLLIFLFVLEIFIGSVYAWSGFGYSEVAMYGDIDVEREMIGNLKERGKFHRASFPNSGMMAGGMIYDIPSIAFFSPYITRHQTTQAYLLGYIDGINWMVDRTDSTPINNSIGATDTLLLSKYTMGAPLDLDYYNYIGETNRFYIYNNPDALSVGIYMPDNISETAVYYSNTPDMMNEIVSRCLKDEDKLYDIDVLDYDEGEIVFLDNQGTAISAEKAKNIFDTQGIERVTGNIPDLRIKMEFVPNSTGWAYLFNEEMIPLGLVKKGEPFSIEMPYPNTRAYATAFNVAIINDAVYDKFIEHEKNNQLDNVSLSHDGIRGDTNYENEGYTMMSIAYNPNLLAFVDGEETAVEDLIGSMAFIKTPKGKHTVELKYRPRGLYTAMYISLASLVIGGIAVMWCEKRQGKKRDISA